MKCKLCREKFFPPTAEVNRGNGKFCSLSCAATHRNNARPKHGKIRLTYAEQKARFGSRMVITQVVSRIQGRSKKSGLPCEMTPDVFREMWKRQNGKCFYTNRPMNIGQGRTISSRMDCVSVDRKDNTLGYTKDNIVLCCLWVNSAKSCGSIQDLKERAKELLGV